MHRLPFTQLALSHVVFTIVVTLVIDEAVFAQKEPARALAFHPVAVWPSGPLDVAVAFDRPFDLAAATAMISKNIPFFEPLGPAADRAVPPRSLGSLRIMGARLTDAGRTLTLATDPHPAQARYVLPLPGGHNRPDATTNKAAETSYDLSGVEVVWFPEGSPDDQPLWKGWWPFLDVEATRRLTQGSKRHEDGLALLAKPGRLGLGTLVRLPKGSVTLRIESTQPIAEAILGDVEAEPTALTSPAETHKVVLTAPSQGDPLFLSIRCETAANRRPFSLRASYRMAPDQTDRAFEREQLTLPWAPLSSPAAAAPLVVPDLSGGDAARGQTIFNGEQARCSQCHLFRGQGGKVGPDLSEIAKQGRAEIYRAITAPSAAIAPEFLSYSVAAKNGQVVVGIVRALGADAIRVTDTNAHATLISRLEIEQIRPSANSIMPVGLTGSLGDAAVRDLIAFLTDRPVGTR